MPGFFNKLKNKHKKLEDSQSLTENNSPAINEDVIVESTFGVDDVREEGTNRTALHMAIVNHENDKAKELLNQQADPWLIDANGFNAVHLAAQCGNDEMLPILLNMRPDWVDLPVATSGKGKFQGMSAIHIAAMHDKDKILKILLDTKPSLIELEVDSKTPLFLAVEHFSEDAVKLLVERGANVDHAISKSESCSGSFQYVHIVPTPFLRAVIDYRKKVNSDHDKQTRIIQQLSEHVNLKLTHVVVNTYNSKRTSSNAWELAALFEAHTALNIINSRIKAEKAGKKAAKAEKAEYRKAKLENMKLLTDMMSKLMTQNNLPESTRTNIEQVTKNILPMQKM